MDKKTKGAWIIHHCEKLRGVTLGMQEYDQINFAGKCGILLNALAASKETEIANDRIDSLAKANGISIRLELPTILKKLHNQRLIDRSPSGITVLGLTTAQTLEHTATIFEEASPAECEKASLEISEKASDLPIVKEDATEYISDVFHLAKKESDDMIFQFEQIGFVDSEDVSNDTLYFNGNLFRRDDIIKINGVISSLGPEDRRKTVELSEMLTSSGCLPQKTAKCILGDILYSKLCSIGFIDENSIGNEAGVFSFVTRPSAFCKFTNSAADDAFDLAKAFVTSLTYGITASPYIRGRITMIEALMKKMIAGHWVGPATAIGQDYKVLELKGVIEVRPLIDGRFSMRLLKKDIGRLALKVITEGEASTESLLQLPSVSATLYKGPEKNRTVLRKKQTAPLKKGVAGLLNDLRTGGIR